MCWHSSVLFLLSAPSHLNDTMHCSVAPLHQAQMFKSHTQTLFTPQTSPDALSRLFRRLPERLVRGVFPLRLWLPVSRDNAIVLSAPVALQPLRRVRYQPRNSYQRGGQGWGERGVGYSSHSRGKWDEKDLNHVHTHIPTHCTLVKNYRRFPAVSETTGTPLLTHKQIHTFLSTHWFTEAGTKRISELSCLLFVTVCWAAHFSHRLLCCCGCLPLTKTQNLSQCWEKRVHVLTKVITKSLYSLLLSAPHWFLQMRLGLCQRSIGQCCIFLQALGCTRKWNNGVWIYEYIYVHPARSTLLYSDDRSIHLQIHDFIN